ncbi:MAG TPA: hypothetical protein VNW72_03955 [Chthoniobacterales bacterium]|nr:hypothetical protein [Chthoniobacterales bacterium]
MNLETINAVAQLIAAIGVIASLFYLAAQIRQNTRSQRSIVVDSLTGSLIALLGPQASDPAQTRAFTAAVEDWHGATEEDRLRASAVLFTLFKLFENAWFQQRQGTLEREQWQGWDLYIRAYCHRPGVKTWWSLRRGMFAAGFRDYLEATEPIAEAVPLSEVIRGKP